MGTTLLFRARMKIRDGNPYVDISGARARALKPGWRRPLPVLVRVNGQPARKPWRINLMPTGTGAFYRQEPEGVESTGRKGRFMARSW